MLRKKHTIQKSFRIDYQLSNDLEYLSNVLNRAQNDLINIALENLIKDNEQLFIEDIIIDLSQNFFDTFQDLELRIDDMNILFDTYAQYVILTITVIKPTKGCILDYEKEYRFNELEELKKDLKKMSTYLDIDGKDVQKYIAKRLDYK